MAVAEFKRIDVIGHNSVKKKIITRLQEKGCVEIIADPVDDQDLTYGEEELESNIQEAATNVNLLKKTLNILETYIPKKTFIEKLTEQPAQREPGNNLSETDYLRIEKCAEQIRFLDDRLGELEKTRESLQQKKSELSVWKSIELSPDEIEQLKHVRVILGSIPSEQRDDFYTALKKCTPQVEMNICDERDDISYIIIIVHKNAEKEITEVLSENTFKETQFPVDKPDETVINQISGCIETLQQLGREHTKLVKNLSENTEHYKEVKALFNEAVDRKSRLSIIRCFGHTETAYVFRGWVPSSDSESVQEIMDDIGPVYTRIFSPGQEDGMPPVQLKNKSFFKPFQLITELYGMPLYNEIDPTAWLAPFFFIFFGLCLSDGGYGVILTLIMMLLICKFGIKGKAFSLFLVCGIATIIAGAMTGGWFGINVSQLPDSHWASFLKYFVVFDPMSNEEQAFLGIQLTGTMSFFYLSIILGYIQVCYGTVLSCMENARKSKWVSALFDDGSWIIFYAGLVFAAASQQDLFGFKSIGMAPLLPAGIVLMSAGVLGKLVCFPVCNTIFGKKGGGPGRIAAEFGISVITVLDNLKNLLGNVLSYCRLMALGLATAVIGSVINQLAWQLKESISIPGLGLLLMILLLFGGHVFNLCVNLLGAFVHTARLQYVEFFPYFFTGGGERFKPFSYNVSSIKQE